MGFSLESWNVRPVRREDRSGRNLDRPDARWVFWLRWYRVVCWVGTSFVSVRAGRPGAALRVREAWPRRSRAYDISQPSPPRALACARGGRRRQCPRERRGSSSWRGCARQGLPGVRLSNRGVVTSGGGADRVGASDVDGAKSRRRHRPMRNRCSERSSDTRQQPCDGRNDFRHDFPDLLDDCWSPASSRSAVQSLLSARPHEQAAGQRVDCHADRG